MYSFEKLEPRILLSADLAPLVTDAHSIETSESSVLHSSTAEESEGPLSAQSTANAPEESPPLKEDISDSSQVAAKTSTTDRSEIIFINDDVEEHKTLQEDFSHQDEQRQVFILDSRVDGLEQISNILAGNDSVDAIHFISHGTEGNVKLGTTWLNADNIDDYTESISSWGDALAKEGDILFYGCDLASSPGGLELLNKMSSLTGADIAASEDATGHETAGGDWLLEYRLGEIEADTPVSKELQKDWVHLLVDQTVSDNFTSGDYAGSTGLENWVENATIGILGESATADQAETTSTKELIIINSNINEFDQLISGLEDAETTGRNFEVVILDTERDGIEQVTSALGEYSDLDGVHFITHGTDGMIKLGNFWLNDSNLQENTDSIAAWGNSLRDNGDILFYGCNIAEGSDGEDLLKTIAELTGADVAASDNITGSAELGGDWELEFAAGQIESSVPLSKSATDSWNNILATLTVTTTVDENDGNTNSITELLGTPGGTGISLREAIIAANNTAGADEIHFNISGAHTIAVGLNGLPVISESVIIDGTTDPDYVDAPIIELIGASAGTATNGLTLTGDGVTVKGLVINQFDGHGISISSNYNTIQGNYIGTDVGATVSPALGNNGSGVFITDSFGNTIGGANPDERNVIVQNSGAAGMVITGAASTGNEVFGNYIGLGPDGSTAMGNAEEGIRILSGASGNFIGGPNAGEGNVISANGDEGLVIEGVGSDGNFVRGNYIGLNGAGDSGLGNNGNGILISLGASSNEIGGNGVGGGNVISANTGNGIIIQDAGTSDNLVRGNFIGTGADGLSFIGSGNGDKGVLVMYSATNNTIGGTGDNDGNLIAYNAQSGVRILHNGTVNNAVLGNVIHSNGQLGIDIYDANFGATEDNDSKDGDTGPNNVQNYPDLTAAIVNSAGDQVTISGTLDSEPGKTFRIEFFTNSNSEPYGEAESYLDGINVTTHGTTGIADINAVLTTTLVAGDYVTATATELVAGTPRSTSEFSANRVVSFEPLLDNNNLTVSQGQTVTLDTTMLSAIDEDNNDAELTFTVSAVSNGYFAYAADTAAAITSFTQDDISNFLVVFIHDGGEIAPAYDVSLSDGTFSTAASPASVTFTDTADGILWLSTNGNEGTGNEVPGLDAIDLEEGDILQQADPGFALGQAATNGTFSIAFDISNFGTDANINGIHYVTSEVIIGSGINAITLQAGDLLLTTANDKSFFSNGASPEAQLDVLKEDIFYFRPDELGDYSIGNFYSLLDDPIQDNTEILGITLIEKDVWVGDCWLSKGDILFSRSGGAEDNDIWLLKTDSLDPQDGGTYSPAQKLIEGDDVGVDIEDKIFGLDILEEATSIGGQNYAAGTILIAIDADDSDGIGGTAQVVNREDIAALTVSKTTLGSGSAQVDASLMFDGNDVSDSDVNFDTDKEAIDGFTLTVDVSSANEAPTFDNTGPYSIDENSNLGTVVGDVDANDGDAGLAAPHLIMTEVMFAPDSVEDDWEWIELYNASSNGIDLSGYVLDDINGLALAGANIANGAIAAGETAILYNSDDVSAANFEAAWGTGLNLIAVTDWNSLPLNNDGDTISLWSNFTDYSGDDVAHANAIFTFTYDDIGTWPIPDQTGSIYLTDFAADPNLGSNWALSTIGATGPTGTSAYQSTAAGGNSGLDIGSPNSGNSGEGVTYSIVSNVDPDGDTNNAFSIDQVTGVITVNDQDDLDFESNNSFVINVRADDGVNTTDAAVTINLNNVNEVPVAVADIFIVNEGSTTNLNLAINDSDVDDGVDLTSISIVSGPTNGNIDSINVDGTVDYTHNGSETLSDSFTYTIDDLATATSNTVTVSLTVTAVNDDPSITSTANTTATEDSAYTYTLTASDVDTGDTLTFSAPTLPTWLTFNTTTGGLSGTPTNDDVGDHSVVLRVSDGTVDIDQSFTITVANTNDDPSITSTANTTATEDSAYTYTLTASDVDTGDTLTFSAPTLPTWLTFNTTTGVLSGTPTNDDVGDHSVVLRVNDGTVDIDQSFTITVANTNDHPVAAPDNAATTENTAIAIDVLANDTDLDTSDTHTISAIGTTGTNGTVTNNGTDVSYDPGAAYDYLAVGETANDTFSYTIDDGNGGTDTETVTVTITGTNDGPIAVADTATTTENAAITIDVLANDTDLDTSDTHTISAIDTTGTSGTVTNNGTDISYDPGTAFDTLAVGETTTDSFSYTIDDGNGGTDTAIVTITITGTNDGPVALADTAVTSEHAPITIDVLANDSDLDTNDSHTISAVDTTGTLGTVINNGTDISYDPGTAFDTLAAGETASDSFSYTIDDGNGGTDTGTVTLTITGTNDGPVAVTDTGATTENTAITIDVLANDTDPDTSDTHSVSAINTTGTNGTVINNGTDLSYDPGTAYDYLALGETANDTFSYTIDDGNGGTDTATVTVTITGTNDGPVAFADTAATTENSAITIDVLGNDTDPDTSDTHTVSAINTTGTNGSVTNNTTDVTYDPGTAYDYLAAGETATDTFSYTIDDGNGGTASQTVTLTITGTNDGPVAVADTAATTENAAISIDVLANDTDLDVTDTLSVSAVNTTGTIGTVTNNGTDVSYDPGTAYDYLAVGETATDTFTYTIDDGNGGTASQTVTLTITGTNDGPVAMADTAATTENTVIIIDVLTNDTDPDTSDTHLVSAIDATGTSGSVTNNGTDVSYDPGTAYDYLAVGETATDTFSYTIDDGNGGTDTETVTLTITGTNDGPTAVADTATTTENAAITIDVLANDTDLDTSDTHTVSAINTTGTSGSVTNNGTDVSYDPGTAFDYLAAGETTTDTFSYTIDDGNGGTDTETATVTITGTNDAPVAVTDTAATTENSAITIDVLANDTDLDTTDTHTISAINTTGTNGTVTNNTTDVSYDPGTAFDYLAAGETATDTFSYTIDDGNGGTASQTVTLTITGTNDGPVAVTDTGATTENTAITIDVLANDTDPDTSDTHTISVIDTTGTNGSVTNNGTDVNYDPGAAYDYLADGETANDTFSYTIDDGNGGTDTATVTLTITGTNDVPMAVADTATTTENSAITIDVLANDTDLDTSDPHTVSAINTTGTNGTVTNNGTDVNYDPGATYDYLAVGETANDTFSYTIDDGHGGTASETVTLTITGTNDGPVAVTDTAATTENTAITIDVLVNDTDLDTSDTHTISAIDTTGTNGSVTNNGTDVSYDPGTAFDYLAVGETATDTFSYTIDDGNGGTDTGTVTLTITGTNDGPVAIADPAATTENSAITIDVLANDTDLDTSDTLIVSAINTSGTSGTVTNNGTDVTYDPGTAYDYLTAGETATDTFSYTIDDGNGGTDTATATVTITGTNDGPVAVADTAATTENAAIAIDVLANDSDLDTSDTHSVSAINTTGTSGTVTNNATDVSYDPGTAFDYLAVGETANDTFSYTIDDGNGGTDTATVTLTITGTNDVPMAVADTATTTENSAITIDVLANDTDLDTSDPHTVSAINTTGTNGTVTNNGTDVNYDPGATYDYLAVGETANDTFSYTIDDGHGGTASETVTLTITGTNDGPVAVTDTAATTENTAITIDVLVNDTDLDTSDTHTISAIDTTGTNGSVTNNGTDVSYDPGTAFDYLAVGETATDTFSYTIDDGNGGTDTGTVTLTITGTNDGPVAIADPAATTENSAITIDVLANDTDLDTSDTLIVSAINTSGTSGTVTNNGTDVTYDPGTAYDYLTAGETATDTFSYTIDDGNGGTDTATATVTITGTNDGPVAVADTAATTENAAIAIDVLANDSDLDTSDTHSVSAINTTGTSGTVTNNATDVSYDPGTAFDYLAVGETANDTFSYTIDDGNGGTDTASVTVTITGTNDGPIAVTDTATTTENAAITIDVLANDTDLDTSDTHSVSAINTTGTSGTVTNNGTDVSYDPGTAYDYLAVGETASDTFSYTIDDGHGGTASETVTVTITGTNDGPVAVADTAATTENSAITIDVLANDTDLDTSDTHTISAVDTTGTNGTVINNTSDVSYDPGTAYDYLADGETANDTFSYTIDDGNGGTASETVTLTITGINDGPVAVADTAATTENATITIDVLANDTDLDISDTHTISAINTTGTSGTVINNGTDVSYDPGSAYDYLADGETATDTFSYTIDDGNGGTASETVRLTITGTNDAPTLDNSITDQTATENSAFTFTLPANTFSDVDASDTLSYSATLDDGSPLPTWLSFNPATGTFSGTPTTSDGFGTINAKVITDDGDSTVAGTFALTINTLPQTIVEDSPEIIVNHSQYTVTSTLTETPDQPENIELSDEDADDEKTEPAVTPVVQYVQSFGDTLAPDSQDSFTVDLSFRDSAASGFSRDFGLSNKSGIAISNTKTNEISLAVENYDLLNLEYRQRTILEYQNLLNSLDSFRDETKHETVLGKTVVGSAIAASTGLSAGYVVWMLRSGALLSSLLSSLPAWQLADPLAILIGRKNESEEDDDSLEEIITKGPVKTKAPEKDEASKE